MDANVAWIPLATSGIACLFVLLAAIGVLRLPDLYSRMQASSKAATVGPIIALVGCAVHFGSPAVMIRVMALIFFLFLTVPLAAHLIGRAGHIAGAQLGTAPLSTMRPRNTVTVSEPWRASGGTMARDCATRVAEALRDQPVRVNDSETPS